MFELNKVTALILILLGSWSTLAYATPEAQSCSEALGQPLAMPGPELPSPLRLLSWNIEKSQNPGWDIDLHTIGQDRHLLLIQEASTQAQIASALPQPLYRAFAAGYISGTQNTGVLTLSTVEPSLQCNLTTWEPWLGTPKATNITEYPIAGTDHRLLAINLHVVNFAVGMEDFAAQIAALSPLLLAHNGPLLVAGDFNTWSKARHAHVEAFMTDHKLSAVTFTPDHRTTFWNKPLDHLYVRGLRPLEARAIVVDTSDHNPLLATLEISE
jgi:endonuclease/exonuclease/phosphatase (EEP) superfamily protein YafD